MKNKFLDKLIRPRLVLMGIVSLAVICCLFYYNIPLAVAGLALFLCVIIYEGRSGITKRKQFNEYIENLTSNMSKEVTANIVKNPLPICITDRSGLIEWHNRKFEEWFPEIDDVMYKNVHQLIPKFKIEEILNKGPDDPPLMVSVKDRLYRVNMRDVTEEVEALNTNVRTNLMETAVPDDKEEIAYRYTFYFTDVTNLENLKKIHRDEKSCSMRLYVDNYEDLMSSVSDEKKGAAATQIESKIRQFAQKNQAALIKTDNDKYYLVLDNKHLDNLIENKFTILDEIREIETTADFPVSLSIGVGAAGKDFSQNHEYSQAAIELALGRGGDQAVVKKINNIEYFGGRLQTVEKRNKGKSRIVGHALKRMIEQSQGVLIMGHKNPDMDAFGAAVGLHAFVKKCNRPAAIVLDSVGESLSSLYEYVKYTGECTIMNTELALQNVNKEVLLVVVDTHSPKYTECPELLKKTEKIVIIDHHRRMAGGIENPTLAYMESYASSACELVTEIIQYVGEKNTLSKVEADALLAGITLDTKFFATQTGVRTFEAATYLRRVGADTSKVRSFFQMEDDLYKVKAKAILGAEFIKLGPDSKLAISRCDGSSANIGLVIAQTADEILTIKGVRGAIVFGENNKKEVVISARSIGDINVQVVMEKLGGGGHLNVAGAQIKKTMDEAEAMIKELVNNEILKERNKK